MLSGIGPPEQLKAVGVELVCASEGVGQNLKDHLHVTESAKALVVTTSASRYRK